MAHIFDSNEPRHGGGLVVSALLAAGGEVDNAAMRARRARRMEADERGIFAKICRQFGVTVMLPKIGYIEVRVRTALAVMMRAGLGYLDLTRLTR